MPTWVQVLLILFSVFVLPFIVAELIQRVLRVKGIASRLGIVLMTIAISVVPFLRTTMSGRPWTDAVKLGIDLAGGTNLVYEVDREAAESGGKAVSDESMDMLTAAIARRVNPAGTKEIAIRRVGVQRVEVIIPGADTAEVERTKREIVNLGSLEFGILANQQDHRELIQAAQDEPYEARAAGVLGRWIPLARTAEGTYKQFEGYGEIAERERDVEGEKVREVLVVIDPEENRLTGKYLKSARRSTDEAGAPAVSFSFNTRGAYLMQNLTSNNRPRKDGFKRRLAIVLNGTVESAPGLEDVISDSGIIHGSFTVQEVKELVAVLNAGALELPLKRDPVNEFTVSPTLGVDVQEKGIRAIVISSLAVFVFMAVYYLYAGLVADLCLILNLILVVGVMSLIDATFTLPGLAGLVLTIGMSVDANVLIYERMREELAKGSSMRLSIRNGFSRAFSTIVDANVTTLITAVVLYVIGTDQVRGFSVSLIIGILAGMFSAVYAGRVIFDISEAKGWIKGLPRFALLKGLNIDFLKYRGAATVFSLVVIGIGMAATFARGERNLDIDFTGGSMVTFEFDKEPELEVARRLLREGVGPDVSLEKLVLAGDNGGADRDLYRLRSTNQNETEVRDRVRDTFAKTEFALKRVSAEAAAVADIPAATEGASDKFAGGSKVDIKVSDELAPGVMVTRLQRALSELPQPPENLSSLEQLVEVTGTAGSGMNAEVGQARRYSAFTIQVSPELPREAFSAGVDSMVKLFATEPVFSEVNSFNASVAGETQEYALIAILVSLLAIVAYIWFRFESVSFGLAAVIALVHDTLVTIGALSIAAYLSGTPLGPLFLFEDFKISLATIASLLTVIGYSLNDTIVIFDRIREIRGRNPELTREMINASVNQTLSRTILTSLTTLIVVVILYAIGGEGIHGFAFCLLVGVITGTYSTIFIANPALLWLRTKAAPASVPAGARAVRS